MAIIRNLLSGIAALTQIVVLHRWRIASNTLSACLSADSVQGLLWHEQMQTSAATQRVSESQPDWRALHRVYFKKPIQYDDAGWTERLHGRFEVPWEQPLFRDHQGTLTLRRYFPAGRHNFVRPYNIVVRLGIASLISDLQYHVTLLKSNMLKGIV
jgi:hypothetical protein